MNDDSKIIDAAGRFRETNKEKKQEQHRSDGAQILRRMKRGGTKLDDKDREKVAQNLSRFMHNYGIDRSRLAKAVDLDNKEIYRLTLRQGEEATYNRLRADPRKYALMIEAIARLADLDKYELASIVTYGTSIHPSSGPTDSDIEQITRWVYDLVDGIEEEFNLIDAFKAIARMKVQGEDNNPDVFWPYSYDPSTLSNEFTSFEFKPDSFWPATGHARNILEIDGPDWPRIIGYLPHFYLGLDDNFDFDCDFWLLPESANQDFERFREMTSSFAPLPVYGSDEDKDYPEIHKWRRHIRDKLMDITDGVTRLDTSWDDAGATLYFNGEPADAFIKSLREFKQAVTVEVTPEEALSIGEELPDTEIDSLWLCIYPNPTTTGLVPVLISANEHYGTEISLFTEERLRELASFKLIGGETVKSRLMRTLLVAAETEEPRLKAEWRRTAGFIEHHPLLKKLGKLQATERHIRKWREDLATRFSTDKEN